MLFADIVERETSSRHIMALEIVCLTQRIPLSYYVDSHSIFRFVQGRDSLWRERRKVTEEVDPQWKQVLRHVSVIDHVHDVLDYEVKRHNERKVYSTTGEIPAIRLERARF